MEFEDAETEEYYLALRKEFGFTHVNFGRRVITMETLLQLRDDLANSDW